MSKSLHKEEPMLKRALSALVGILIFLALCFGGLLPFAIGATVIAALATYEWVTAYQRADDVEAKAGDRRRLPRWLNALNVLLACAGLIFPLLMWVGYGRLPYPVYQTFYIFHNFSLYDFRQIILYRMPWLDAYLLLIPVLVFGFLLARARRGGYALGFLRPWYGLVGMIYVGLLMSSLVRLRSLAGPIYHVCGYIEGYTNEVRPFGDREWGAWLMLLVAVCVWMTDTGAYLVGRKWGKHKLAPTLSPNKTVEGSVGGLALAVLTGVCFGLWIHLSWQHGLVVGLIAGVMGQMGDLFESALKREIGIKDFGGIMPGHGGALDRFDSLLFVTPLAFCYLHFIAKL